MSNQEMFVKLMQDITGDDTTISLQSKVNERKSILEKTCEDFKDLIKKGVFLIEAKNQGFEFCPFCCTGGEEAKFEFVWVGINPGIGAGRWPEKFYWEETTWQDMVDFYVPQGDIRYKDGQSRDDPQNVYQWLSQNGVWSKYYKLMIRIHMALLGEKNKYGTWSELWEAYSETIGSQDEEAVNDAIEDAFLQQLNDHPTLSAELLPFKSKEMKFDAENMIKDSRYKAYFKRLIDFIVEKSSKNAWIWFCGDTDSVKKILTLQKNIKVGALEYVPIGEKNKPGSKFYLYKWGKRKVIVSPFLQPYHKNGNDISAVIDKMREYFKEG